MLLRVVLYLTICMLPGPLLWSRPQEPPLPNWGEGGWFDDAPSTNRLYPRAPGADSSRVRIEGVLVDPAFTGILVSVQRDGRPDQSYRWSRPAGADTARFRVEFAIEAGRYAHFVTLFAEHDGESTLVREARDVVGGDALLIQGQSNAVARAWDGSAAGEQSPWVRSFDGSAWNVAGGNGADGWSIGQWGLRMARLLADSTGMPVAVLNGGEGGRQITHFLRNDDAPEDPATNYGRFLRRARRAGLAASARAVLWYQGESDANTAPEDYAARFDVLYRAWHEDLPGIERIFVFQIRAGTAGCTASPFIQETHRRLPDRYADLELMSTTAVNGYDGCHFSFENGYRVLGERMYRLVRAVLYDAPERPGLRPPNPLRASFFTPDRTEIAVEMRDPEQVLSWTPGAHADFRLLSSDLGVTGGRAAGAALILSLDRPGRAGLQLSYRDPSGPGGAWVTNAEGIGLLAFHALPVEPSGSGVRIEEERRELSGDVRLLPGFPNPFTARTTLRFRVDRATHVRVTILDGLGRERAHLADAPYPPGSHSISWAPGAAPAGTYWCRLEALDQTLYRPLVRLR